LLHLLHVELSLLLEKLYDRLAHPMSDNLYPKISSLTTLPLHQFYVFFPARP
jgi:hypothetical protein